MSDFWTDYLDSITEKEDKILVRWDTCTVGGYSSIEEAREKLRDSSSYRIDKTDFWYKEFNGEWKHLYEEY